MIGKMRFGMAAVVILTACSLANADPVRWEPSEGGNGHWYEFVAEPRLTWCDARDAAQTREHLGETGHLTTITSPEEYGFLFDEFSDDWDTVDVAIWLGGYQPVDEPGWDPGVEPAGGWRWVDVPYLSEPEEWDYTYLGRRATRQRQRHRALPRNRQRVPILE